MANEKDLKLAFETIRAKQLPYDLLFNYYDGDQPLVYMAKRLNEIFKDLDGYFAENWCSVVIDSAKDRVNLNDIQVDSPARAIWREIFEASEIALESDDVHEAAMVAGEGYFVAWREPVVSGQLSVVSNPVQGFNNDPRMVHLFYERYNPRLKRMGCKMWVNDDLKLELTLYYPERIEYYVSQSKAVDVSSWNNFIEKEKAQANPFNEIPIFHFRTSGRLVKSDLKNVIPIQNGINKLLTDMMVTAEYMAFPQRYIISQAEVRGKVRNAPNEILDLPAGDGIGQQTQVGQFEAAKLENYINSIDNLATAISSITRTPKHYFFSIGSNLSGEALIAMEAPLNKKAQDRIDRYTPVWRDVARFMLKMAGENVDPRQISPQFDRAETVQPFTTAQARQTNVNAGMPLVTVLREEGKSQEFINEMLRDKTLEREAQQTTLANHLLQAQRNFNGTL